MESKIVEQKQKKELTFPLIAKNKHRNLIVLFSDVQTGTVLVSEGTNWGVGEYYNEWVRCMDKSEWKILYEVTINFKS